MGEEDYRKIADFLQKVFKEYGLNEIADFRNYELEREGERFIPDDRKLVSLMLEALRRVIVLGSQRTIDESLDRIGNSIKEENRPEGAWIHFDNDPASEREGRKEPEQIIGVETNEIEAALRELVNRLDNPDWEPPEKEGVTQ